MAQNPALAGGRLAPPLKGILVLSKMSREISGLITTFPYEGELRFCHLVSDFAFIPLDSTIDGYRGQAIPPFVELTAGIEQLAMDLSRHGAVAYIETHYHGGMGCQMAIVWQDGRTVLGPLASMERPPVPRLPWWRALFARTVDRDEAATEAEGSKVQSSDEPINEALRYIGVHRQGEDDEFDTAGLGRSRSNDGFLNE